MKKVILFSILLFIQTAIAQTNIKTNQKAPQISITDWVLNVPKDKTLDKKFIVLEFWATWCGPCIEAVPHLNEIQSKFNRKDLYFISITDESVDKVNRISKRIPFKSIVVSDTSKKTQIAYGNGVDGLEAFPMTVLIDNEGIIKWIGMPTELTESIVNDLVNKKLKPYNVFEAETIIKMEDETISQSTNNTSKPEDFMDIIQNKKITHLFRLEKTDSKLPNSSRLNDMMFYYESLNIKEIFTEIIGMNPLFIEIDNDLLTNRYSITYKNSNRNVKKDLEKEFIDLLGLTKTVNKKPISLNKVTVKNQKLLEKALDEMFSSKSDAGEKIIFSGITLNDLIRDLNTKADKAFEINSEDNTRYDFVINVSSTAEIIKSLKSYGLEAKEETVEREIIALK